MKHTKYYTPFLQLTQSLLLAMMTTNSHGVSGNDGNENDVIILIIMIIKKYYNIMLFVYDVPHELSYPICIIHGIILLIPMTMPQGQDHGILTP